MLFRSILDNPRNDITGYTTRADYLFVSNGLNLSKAQIIERQVQTTIEQTIDILIPPTPTPTPSPTPTPTASKKATATPTSKVTAKATAKATTVATKKPVVKKTYKPKPRKTVKVTPSPSAVWPPKGYFADKGNLDIYAKKIGRAHV